MSTCLGRCTICTLVLEPDDFVGLKCGHTYHNECITKWITHAKNCPKCRTKNTTRDITKLYVDDVDSNATINGNFLESISLAERDQRIKNLEAQLKGSNEQRDKFESELKQQMSKVAQIRLTLSTKESQLRLIEHRLEDQTALKVRLESAMAHLKTTEFYALLSRKCHADEATIARELNKYLDQNSSPNPIEFLTLIRSQLKKANTDKKELNSQMKELNHHLIRETVEKEKLRRELLEARSELESARKRPALTGFGDSPASKPGRKQKYSMGFSFTAQMEEQQLEETPEKQEEDSDIQIISPRPKQMPQQKPRKSRRQCIDFVEVENEQPLQLQPSTSSIGRNVITLKLPSPIYPVKAVKPVRLQKKKPYLDIKDKELNEIFSPNLRAHATNSEWKN